MRAVNSLRVHVVFAQTASTSRQSQTRSAAHVSEPLERFPASERRRVQEVGHSVRSSFRTQYVRGATRATFVLWIFRQLDELASCSIPQPFVKRDAQLAISLWKPTSRSNRIIPTNRPLRRYRRWPELRSVPECSEFFVVSERWTSPRGAASQFADRQWQIVH